MVIVMEIGLLMLNAFLFSYAVCKIIINFQLTNCLGQIERVEGLSTHRNKNHTPTMGGIAFVCSTIIFYTLYVLVNNGNWLVYGLLVFPMISYGFLGLIDDLLIIKRGKNDGIKPKLKFFLQIVIATVYFFWFLKYQRSTTINLLFWQLDLKFMYGIFILLAFSGFSNATNLTDGIDGLLAGIMIMILVAYSFLSLDISLNSFLGILIATLLAFLVHNLPKAKLFMGNAGALALGGGFVSIALLLQKEYLLIIFGEWFVIETLSVIMQVSFYKLSKGRRLFKMAPIHHHFEIVLGSEKKTLYLIYLINFIWLALAVILLVIGGYYA